MRSIDDYILIENDGALNQRRHANVNRPITPSTDRFPDRWHPHFDHAAVAQLYRCNLFDRLGHIGAGTHQLMMLDISIGTFRRYGAPFLTRYTSDVEHVSTEAMCINALFSFLSEKPHEQYN
jgi:hypothetical protein